MGLKDDLIEAKAQGLMASPSFQSDTEIDTSNGSQIEVEAELTKEAIANFLTSVEFRITKLAAPVVVEDLVIPERQVNVLERGTYQPYPGGAPAPAVPVTIIGGGGPEGRGGAELPEININKSAGGLDSTGYVYIGEDPDTQEQIDVSDEDGQRFHTTVKLIREDIEDLL